MLRIKRRTTHDPRTYNTVFRYDVERKGKLLFFWDYWFFCVGYSKEEHAREWIRREVKVTGEEADYVC